MRRDAIAAIVLAVAVLASAPLTAEGRLRLEGGPLLPYRFNRALLASEAGLRGDIVATGVRWDGSRAVLFRSAVAATTDSFEVAFYLDEDFRSLELRAGTAAGEAGLSLDLSRSTGLGAPADPAEAATRSAMRELRPPIKALPSEAVPRRMPLDGLDLLTAASRAASTLFDPPYPWAAIALLAAAAIAAAVAAALPRRGEGDEAAGGGAKKGGFSFPSALFTLGGILAVSAAAALLASRPPVLYRAIFPSRDPSLTLSGYLERRSSARGGYALVQYSPPSEGPAELAESAILVAIEVPPGSRLPLDEAAPAAARVRFSPPPVVAERGGSFFLEGNSVGWVLDETR